MLSHEERSALAKPVRTLQIIVIGLLMGVMSFATLVIVLRQSADAKNPPSTPPPSAQVLGYAALGVGGAALLLMPVLMNFLVGAGRRSIARGAAPTVTTHLSMQQESRPFMQSEKGKLFQLYLTRTIIAAALIEGAALINLVACMQIVWLPNLYLIMLLAVALAAQTPTLARVERWLDRQERLLMHERTQNK